MLFPFYCLDTPIGPVIKQMWDEEKEHLDICERFLAKHHVNPTLFTPLFKQLAYGLGKEYNKYYYNITSIFFNICFLGVGSALIGKEGAMACTIAVEELIGGHYNDQIKELIALDLSTEDQKELLKVSIIYFLFNFV